MMMPFLLSKRIDWSSLNESFSIPSLLHQAFYESIGSEMLQESVMSIKIILDDDIFKLNVFNSAVRYKADNQGPDYVRIEYQDNTRFVLALQKMFIDEHKYFLEHNQTKKGRKVMLPDTMRTELILSSTDERGVFKIERFIPFSKKDSLLSSISEEMFEGNTELMIDPNADIVTKERIVKTRKLDRSICDNLKKLYDYTCQMTGERIGDKYGMNIVEAHHIDYFTESKNNDASNIIILSPNYHRIIHMTNPFFNRKKLQFEFSNGLIEKVKINKHL